MTGERKTCGATHPDDAEIVCTLFEHDVDHHRGWADMDDGPVPIHWGARAGRMARTPQEVRRMRAERAAR